MTQLTRRRFVVGVELFLGVAVLLVALAETHETFRPLGRQPIDGRGLFAMFFIPPLAAFGGVLIAHALSRSVLSEWPRRWQLLVYPCCSVLAVIPSVAYLLVYAEMSKELTTYLPWFAVALVVSLVPVAYIELDRRL